MAQSGPEVKPREELRADLRGLGLVFKSSPPLAVGLLLLTVVQGAAPAVVVAQTGRFLAVMPDAIRLGASSSAGREARGSLALIATAVFLTQVLGPVQQALLFGVQRRFEAYLSRRLMAAAMALPGIAHFEDPSFRDELSVSHWIAYGPVHTLQFVSSLFQQATAVAAMAAVAATYAGWVPLLVLVACIPAGVGSWRFQAVTGMARWRGSPDIRRADYYRDMAVVRESGKELRVFRLGDWALGRQARHWLAGVQESWTARRRTMAVLLGLHALALAAMGFAFLVMLDAAVDGRTDVGTFTAASLATVSLTSAVMMLVKEAGSARRNSFYLPSAMRLLDMAQKDPRLAPGGTRPATDLARTGIRFEGVSFSYPGSSRPVLDRLDLDVAAGSSVALVGENGAGKTTLIKLLCRFYDPTEGRITVDGVDIRELDLASLRNRLAVIFQDFVRYQLSARDNVGFGAVERLGDDDLLAEAARRVAVLDRIESLPDGWDTPLAREFGGVDLSGGEWQRVALARAMAAQMGRDADLLVLDEPTASLDVRVEHELYEHFAELSRDRTTLLVSHRFSTVRMAQRIVLLERGRVVEDGSHDELMARGGRYADLYRLQASHYAAEAEADAAPGPDGEELG